MRVCLVGVGLIAGSLGLALREKNQTLSVVGLGRHAETLERGVTLGVLDEWSLDPAIALAKADIVVLGVPLGATANVLSWIKPHLPKAAVITDVGSAKGCVIEDVEAVFGELPVTFVPGHPIAGTEHSGIDAAFGRLFLVGE
jgi:Prephenate dehydrogenase